MIVRWLTVLLLLFFVLGCEVVENRNIKQSTPRFVIIFFAHEQAEIVKQGVMSQSIFQRLFLDSYEFNGERYHPGKDAIVQGVLFATDKANVVTVPIWVWEAVDGSARFLCQVSDDGRPPAFSVFSRSEGDLLKQVLRVLGH